MSCCDRCGDYYDLAPLVDDLCAPCLKFQRDEAREDKAALLKALRSGRLLPHELLADLRGLVRYIWAAEEADYLEHGGQGDEDLSLLSGSALAAHAARGGWHIFCALARLDAWLGLTEVAAEEVTR